MTAWHALAGIVLCLITARYLWRWHVASQRKALGEHVSREAIRQAMDLHPHERGEVPAADEAKADPVLALRIAQGLSRGLWTRRLSR
jgi:hypothetical protein